MRAQSFLTSLLLWSLASTIAVAGSDGIRTRDARQVVVTVQGTPGDPDIHPKRTADADVAVDEGTDTESRTVGGRGKLWNNTSPPPPPDPGLLQDPAYFYMQMLRWVALQITLEERANEMLPEFSTMGTNPMHNTVPIPQAAIPDVTVDPTHPSAGERHFVRRRTPQ